MGSAKSKSQNLSENTVRSFTDVINETIQSNESAISNVMSTDVLVSGGSRVDELNIGGKQYVRVNKRAIADIANSTNLQNQIDQSAQQQAKAITEALALPWQSSNAQNIARLTTEVGYQVRNAFSQECISIINNLQTTNVRVTDGSSVGVINISSEQLAEDISNCVANNQNVTQATTALKQAIDQTGTAESGALFSLPSFGIVLGIVGGIILLILLIIILFVIFRSRKPKQDKVSPPTESV